jgi:glycosyltransferase involved in cell wall biosynthesis
MKVLIVTNMYPTADQPHFGIFVEEQVESLRRLGLEVDVLFINGRRSKLNYLAGYPRLWWRLLRHRYDLIHAHYIFAGLVARGQIGTPVVLTHHGPEVFMTWEAGLCRTFTRYFDAVVTVSEELRQRLPYEAATVIPCGVDLQRFSLRPRDEVRRELGLPLDREIVLWAGEPQRPEKRFELVREAFSLLRERRSGVDLVLLSGRPHDVVPDYMNAANVLVLTSDAEGSPMVIKEAMACDLPIVSTAVGDVAQVIEGTAGCFICSQDPADIAAKLQLALDFGRRTDGSRAVRHLDLQVIARQLVEVYENTLSARSGRSRRDAVLEKAGRR